MCHFLQMGEDINKQQHVQAALATPADESTELTGSFVSHPQHQSASETVCHMPDSETLLEGKKLNS